MKYSREPNNKIVPISFTMKLKRFSVPNIESSNSIDITSMTIFSLSLFFHMVRQTAFSLDQSIYEGLCNVKADYVAPT